MRVLLTLLTEAVNSAVLVLIVETISAVLAICKSAWRPKALYIAPVCFFAISVIVSFDNGVESFLPDSESAESISNPASNSSSSKSKSPNIPPSL